MAADKRVDWSVYLMTCSLLVIASFLSALVIVKCIDSFAVDKVAVVKGDYVAKELPLVGPQERKKEVEQETEIGSSPSHVEKPVEKLSGDLRELIKHGVVQADIRIVKYGSFTVDADLTFNYDEFSGRMPKEVYVSEGTVFLASFGAYQNLKATETRRESIDGRDRFSMKLKAICIDHGKSVPPAGLRYSIDNGAKKCKILK